MPVSKKSAKTKKRKAPKSAKFKRSRRKPKKNTLHHDTACVIASPGSSRIDGASTRAFTNAANFSDLVSASKQPGCHNSDFERMLSLLPIEERDASEN